MEHGRVWPPPAGAAERALVAVALAAMVGFTTRLVLIDCPFDFDEAVYASGALSRVTGESRAPYPIYRPVGMQVLAAPAVWLGGSDIAFRMIFVLAGAGCLLAFWLAGRRIAGAASSWSALAMGLVPELQGEIAKLMSDVVSVGLVFLLVWVLMGELERAGGPRRRLLAVAPLAAAAFYVRYGSALVLFAVAAAAAAVWWRQIAEARRLVLATVGLFAALLVPHVIHSLVATGSALGIMRAGHIAANRAYFGEGLVFYVTVLPRLPGILPALVLVILGLGSGALHVVRLRRRADAPHRGIAFAFLAAVLHIAVIGVDVHGEARFIFFGLMLLTLLGVHAVMLLAGRAGASLPAGAATTVRPVMAAAAALLLLFLGLRADDAAARDFAGSARSRGGVTRAARILRERGGRSCAVFSAQMPQLAWYSGCRGYPMSSFPRVMRKTIRRMRQSGHSAAFLVLFERGMHEPTGQKRALLVAESEPPPIAVIEAPTSRFGDATVYRLRVTAPAVPGRK